MENRREFVKGTLATLSALCAGSFISRDQIKVLHASEVKMGPLKAADKNGVKLPEGFTSRIVARSSQTSCEKSDYKWHGAPDGGEVYACDDGGWIYVSNSELNKKTGGVGALRFNAKGDIIDSYSILDSTSRNCAGGASPWGTWLSCEEFDQGRVWECDPWGKEKAVVRPALGVFNHEAICFDMKNKAAYLTEDKGDGRLYRFVSKSVKNDRMDLDNGQMQVAKVDKATNKVTWLDLPDPLAKTKPTRNQVKDSTVFKGGEGIVFHKGIVSFTTKGDNRVWSYDTKTETISIVYDYKTNSNPILTGVDNITVTPKGELIVAEDGGDLQIVGLDSEGKTFPVLQLEGHKKSEICGPAFSPDGTRLYFSSQRGTTGKNHDGITFEVTGPFKG